MPAANSIDRYDGEDDCPKTQTYDKLKAKIQQEENQDSLAGRGEGKIDRFLF